MSSLMFTCPTTRMKVHAWVADDPAAPAFDYFEAVECTACRGFHMINPRSGRVLGEDDGGVP
jgi:hypothetical protein